MFGNKNIILKQKKDRINGLFYHFAISIVRIGSGTGVGNGLLLSGLTGTLIGLGPPTFTFLTFLALEQDITHNDTIKNNNIFRITTIL